jgi:hypothetical protein
MCCIAVELISNFLIEARAKAQSMMKPQVNKTGVRLAFLRFSVKAKRSSKALKKKFLDDLSNSVRPFDYMVKAGQSARPKTKK